MNNNEIIIDDGAKEYVFKNKLGEVIAKFSFNPADTGFVERYKSLAEYLENYSYNPDDDTEEAIVSLDNTLKEEFNKLFNKDISSELFARYNPCTVFADGRFFMEVAIEWIGKFIEQGLDERLNSKIANIRKDMANKG